MKKRRIVWFCFFLFVTIIIIYVYCVCTNPGMLFLPKEQLMLTNYSPNNNYRLDVFLNNGGATVAWSITVVLNNENSGSSRNLFFQYLTDEADIIWLSDDVVLINGIRLDVTKDSYNSKWN